MLFENIKKTKDYLCETNPVVENYILCSAKLQTSHNWAIDALTGTNVGVQNAKNYKSEDER